VDGKPVEAKVGTDAEYGNKMAYLGVDEPRGDVVLSWSATITRQADVGQGKGPMSPRFTQADHLVPIDGKAAELAKEILGDAKVEVRQRGKKIYDNVLTTMKYSKDGTGWGRGDFDFACSECRGNCTDFHAKFTGIARAAGIRVRFTMGIPLAKDAKGTPGGYHCWAHFHDGSGWIPVDISEAQKVADKDPAKAQWFFGHLDPDRLSLQVGRDLTLVPAQKGDKLLFFAYPYAEVNGKKVDVPKEARSFSYENK
jgi:transglutaminase-like putative cysteine protease